MNITAAMVAKKEALRQMNQIDHDSKQQTLIGVALAIVLAFVVDTPVAHFAARATLLGALGILINGSLLLHRKWDEAVAIDKQITDYENPSARVSRLSKIGIGISATLAFGAPALAIIAYSWHRFPQLLPW
jgi:hypothetical protein